jgi:hypothetical protein
VEVRVGVEGAVRVAMGAVEEVTEVVMELQGSRAFRLLCLEPTRHHLMKTLSDVFRRLADS